MWLGHSFFFILIFNLATKMVHCKFKDTKVDVDKEISEIRSIVQEWASSLSKELTSLSEFTRKERVAKSFESYTIYEEKWSDIVEVVAKNIRDMMDDKIKAVKAIKEHAELLSLHRKEDILTSSSYDYYDANNLTVINDTDRTKDMEFSEKIWKCAIPVNVNNNATANLCFENSYQSYQQINVPNNTDLAEYQQSNVKQIELGRCNKIAFLNRTKDYYQTMKMYYHPHFDTEVNLNYSIVRVTPSVHNREQNVLNEIRWSEALDLTFKCNFKRDPTLTYQFFGSPKGFMRYYPATNWSTEPYDNTFDFRTRPWYLEAMCSSKDIVILLDRSGSMLGIRRIVATQIVNAILDTLTDNDYVNIYTFTNTSEPLVDCFNETMVQANEENLRLLREQLSKVVDEFYSDISLGFEKAFPLLEQHKRSLPHRQACNQAIMLITEGLDYEYNVTLFDIYNRVRNQSGKVIDDDEKRYYRPIRVFTYLLGIEPTEAKRMNWIACANMGYYANITVIEEVREKVFKYLEVMSRPINFRKPYPVPSPWSALNVHLADRRLSNWLWKKYEGNRQRDKIIQYETEHMKDMGQTLVVNQTHFTTETNHTYQRYQERPEYHYITTVSMPVYDRRKNGTSLLGVAGVDVPLDYVKQLAEPHRIGVNGYSFTITNNGYVLHHPDHRTEFADHILKPTFNRVDVTEVEISDETQEPRNFDPHIIELRNNIVRQLKGVHELRVRAPIDNMKRVMVGRRHYYYTEIGPFSLVIALPDKYGVLVARMNVTQRTINDIKEHLRVSLDHKNNKNNKWRVHPKWLYTCNTTRAEKLPEEELLHFLHTNSTDCKEHDLVNSLLKDVNVTEWFNNNDDSFAQIRNRTMYHNGVVLAFMATHTGLTRWKDLKNEKYVRHLKHFAETHNRATDEIYYRRAAEMNHNEEHQDKFIYSVPFEDYHPSKTLITASHVIFLKKGKKKHVPVAAVGYQIFHRTLNGILRTFTCPNQQPCKISCVGVNAWTCYVVDNDGYIILSNNTENVGKSLADVDIALMKTMVKDGVFKEVTVFDYQGTCFPDYTSTEPFYGPTTEQIKDKHMTCPKSNPIKCKTIEYMRLQLKKTTPTPCDIELKMYNYQFKRWSHLHPAQNDRDCPCPYISEPIQGTNLMLIALDDKCCDKATGAPTNQYPKEIAYGRLSLPCHIAVNNNFTKRHYTKCYSKHPAEFRLNSNTSYCGNEEFEILES